MFFQTLSNVTRVDMALICIPHSATRTSSQPRNPSRINENKAKIHFPREKKSRHSDRSLQEYFTKPGKLGLASWLLVLVLWSDTWHLKEEGIWGITVWGDTVYHSRHGSRSVEVVGHLVSTVRSRDRKWDSDKPIQVIHILQVGPTLRLAHS